MSEENSPLQEDPIIDEETSTKEQIEGEEKTIETLQREVKEQKEKYLRVLAEMENVRKRMQKERHETTRFAVENVIREFLVPLDHFENAMGFTHQMSEETQTWARGFEMILTQFKEILKGHQVVPFQSEGIAFDPHLHEVIEMEETEEKNVGMVLQEFLRGYRCGERVLRPARVKVGKRRENQTCQPQDQLTSKGEENHD